MVVFVAPLGTSSYHAGSRVDMPCLSLLMETLRRGKVVTVMASGDGFVANVASGGKGDKRTRKSKPKSHRVAHAVRATPRIPFRPTGFRHYQ
jgi:hypothetical protein